MHLSQRWRGCVGFFVILHKADKLFVDQRPKIEIKKPHGGKKSYGCWYFDMTEIFGAKRGVFSF